MKLHILSIVLCFCLINSLSAQENGRITTSERNLLLNYLELGEQQLLETLRAIDDGQWIQQPNNGSWSIAQNMGHILLAEQGLFQNIQSLLEQAQNPQADLWKKDAWLIGKINDRGNKVKTPLGEEPQLMDKAEAIEQLKASRKSIALFLQNEDLALRNHVGKSPYGPADTYQLFLVLAAHGVRHHAQMQEVLVAIKKGAEVKDSK